MTKLRGLSVTVAGAGALGLTVAVRLAQAGARVTVCDPSPLADNASGVAAGMLAPAFECALDPEGAELFPNLVAARDLWPGLLQSIGAPEAALDRSGAVMAGLEGEEARLSAAADRLDALGTAPEPLSPRALRALHPLLSPAVTGGFRTREDWRLHPAATLTALASALRALGGVWRPDSLRLEGGRPTLAGQAVEGAVVIAAGAEGGGLAGLAPELAVLSPVKGQILQFDAGPVSGPAVRGTGGYIAPQPTGAVAGATMEAGRSDRTVEAATLERLRAQAARLFPHLADAPAAGRAGVRAATPDGAPLVGASAGGEGVLLCVGARRNGWLIAPLAAAIVAATLAGEDPGPHAAAFDPQRFAGG